MPSMKSIGAFWGLVALVMTAGCLDQVGGARSYQGPLFRYHYAGRAHLPEGTNATRFKEIDALPATAEFRSQLSQKLAAAALPFWRKDLPAGATDQSALLQPLLEDFWISEALVEVRGTPGQTDTAIAIELTDARAQVWDRNLRQLTTNWKLGTPQDLTMEGFKGWQVKKAQAPNTFQFIRAGKWVVIGLGQEKPAQTAALLSEAKRAGRPLPLLKTNFFELSADLPALRAWAPVLAKWPLPPIVAWMSGRGEYVRSEVKFQYSGKVPWTYEPWKIPTNLVSEPLTSFTVGRGISPFLKAVKGFDDAGLSPPPNQFCAWGINHEQCRMFFTMPVASGAGMVRQLASKLPISFESRFPRSQGKLLYSSNASELLLSGVPFIVPMLKAETNGADQFLMGAVFPALNKPVPAPRDLFAQLGARTNVMYYDWEITEQRLNHGKQFYQLLSILDQRQIPGTNSPSKRWLSAIGPKLVNTVTEIVQTGPQELSLVRKSHLGWTGFELATLSVWLDSPGFPFTFELPPHISTRTLTNAPARTNGQSPPSKPGAPANSVPPPKR